MTRDDKLKKILTRIAAVVAFEITGVIGVGAVFGVDVIISALIAAALGVNTVIRGIAGAYLDDGKLTNAEIDAAFQKIHKQDDAS
jgi:hypothetical protein